jgi:hypothetical protein
MLTGRTPTIINWAGSGATIPHWCVADLARGFLIVPPATALHKCEQASRNPAARLAGRPSAGRRETASHSSPPRRADSRRGSRLRTPDTSTANRPSSFSLPGRSRIGTRPCGLPFGENGMGREKRNRCPGAGQRAKPATRGRLFPLWERKGKARGCSRSSKKQRRSDAQRDALWIIKNGTLATARRRRVM